MVAFSLLHSKLFHVKFEVFCILKLYIRFCVNFVLKLVQSFDSLLCRMVFIGSCNIFVAFFKDGSRIFSKVFKKSMNCCPTFLSVKLIFRGLLKR